MAFPKMISSSLSKSMRINKSMKFYLSSYKLGNEVEKLKKLIPYNKIGYIPNARDYPGVDLEKKKESINRDVSSLQELGLNVEVVDLRDYFNKRDDLEKKLNELGAIFISGGNVFILRQAMKLSGLDWILEKFKNKDNFLYAGYSAAGCVLAPILKPYEIVDDATALPYEELKNVILEGLGFVDFTFMPHFDSDHPESEAIGKEIEFCKKNNIEYRAIRDGEVIIIE